MNEQILNEINTNLKALCAHLGLPSPIAVPVTVGTAEVTPAPETSNTVLSAVETIKAGKKLTGAELDEQGCPHIPEVHTQNPALTTKGIYKKGKGVSADVYSAAVEKAIAEAAVAVPDTPKMPPVPSAEVTPAPESTGIPMPGVPESPMRDAMAEFQPRILATCNRLSQELDIDMDSIVEVFAENGSTTGDVTGLPADKFETVLNILTDWETVARAVVDTTKAVLEMNANNQAVLVEHIYNKGQFGCTNYDLVSHADMWKLYEALHKYRVQLENHFQKPVTEMIVKPASY